MRNGELRGLNFDIEGKRNVAMEISHAHIVLVCKRIPGLKR